MPTAPAPEPDPPGAARRLWPRRAAAAVVLAVLAGLVLGMPVPFYVQSPGPVFGLADVVQVAGAEPIDGDFLFLTIRLDDTTLLGALRAGLDGDVQLISRAAMLGEESEDAFMARQDELFARAESTAVALGLELVGADLDPDDVAITSDGVGGPSAGLMMTLAVADLASPEDIADGRLVAGTGSVAADGTVGPVGSIVDKVRAAEAAGADVLLVPEELARTAQDVARTIRVVGVRDVDEALSALRR